MNYISCIVQILEIPKIKLYDEIPMINFRVQLPYTRNKPHLSSIAESNVWGNLAYDIINYYRINDYVLIEGYISSSKNNLGNNPILQITILRLYPFLFTVDVDKDR